MSRPPLSHMLVARRIHNTCAGAFKGVSLPNVPFMTLALIEEVDLFCLPAATVAAHNRRRCVSGGARSQRTLV